MHYDTPEITTSLVESLISEQFPEWHQLEITPVKNGGWDNRTFHLGNDMSVRLPSAAGYAAQVLKEQTWLPVLSKKIGVAIPFPIAMGQPNDAYPWQWSVYQWIHGESINNHQGNLDLEKIAVALARFLTELQAIDVTNGPKAGLHNYFRGGHPSVYGSEALKSIDVHLSGQEKGQALTIWENAVTSEWSKPDVWVHGDVSSGNLLLNQQGELTAVIDFGCLGVGDPACDLIIAWTLFDHHAREIFKKGLMLDDATWHRAKGWTLWKCLQDSGPESKIRAKVLENLLVDG